MSDTLNRRTFLQAAPLALVPIGATAGYSANLPNSEDQIAHHLAELVRLLRETAPEGFEVQSIHWHSFKGPEAPEDFMVTARTDRDLAIFRPRFRETWWVCAPLKARVSIPVIG